MPTIKGFKQLNVQVSEKLYQRMVEECEKCGQTKGEFINFLLGIYFMKLDYNVEWGQQLQRRDRSKF